MKKIGLFGGTFDPVHCGHINLAFELMEKRGLDEVWLIPSKVNPFKTKMPPVTFEHRLSMLQEAIKEIPQFSVKDIENTLSLPSYTIHTLKALFSLEAPDKGINQFYLLMGEDAIAGFNEWYLPEEIVQLVPLLIASRSAAIDVNKSSFSPLIWKAIQEGWTATRVMDISGTLIRERLEKGLYCGHLLNSSVLTYIKANHLYME